MHDLVTEENFFLSKIKALIKEILNGWLNIMIIVFCVMSVRVFVTVLVDFEDSFMFVCCAGDTSSA